MIDWKSMLAAKPVSYTWQKWFSSLAEGLLNRCELLVAGQPHRLVEVEFYYHSDHHPDPFVHCSKQQQSCELWSFHRQGESYRGGSFKGLDLSFGEDVAYGGILLRTFEDEQGRPINGCSLCVDHLLQVTGHSSVAELDSAMDGREVWDASSPLYLRHNGSLERREVLSTARVGLTLKRWREHPEMTNYLLLPYRFTTELTLRKGKAQTLAALLSQQRSAEEIHRSTRSSLKTIRRLQQAREEGSQRDWSYWSEKRWKAEDIVGLHGFWEVKKKKQ